jgi:hypothetical protein
LNLTLILYGLINVFVLKKKMPDFALRPLKKVSQQHIRYIIISIRT